MNRHGCLVDTNILLRISRPNDPDCGLIQNALRILTRRNIELCFSLQNMAEFWNASTRPIERNGFGIAVSQTNEEVKDIEETMTLVPDTQEVYSHWRRLVVAHAIRGVQVHDARLVAIMLAHNIPNILTLNDADFLRFPEITAVHPRALQT